MGARWCRSCNLPSVRAGVPAETYSSLAYLLRPIMQGGDGETVSGKAMGGFVSDLARSDRLRILGNGVVPQQAAYAWHLLRGELADADLE